MSRVKKDNIERKRFTTLLPRATHRKIRILAANKDKAIYEIIEEALNSHLRKEGMR